MGLHRLEPDRQSVEAQAKSRSSTTSQRPTRSSDCSPKLRTNPDDPLVMEVPTQVPDLLHVAVLTGCETARYAGCASVKCERASMTTTSGRSLSIEASGKSGPRARTYRWGHKEPKSGKSRTILVDARVIEIGQERLGKMRDVAKMLRVPAPEDGYVFSEDLIGEGPLKPSFVSNTFRRIKTRAGIDCRLHDLRGYSITEMLANKIDVNTVADYHRHQDPTLTLRRTPCRAKKPSAEPFSPSGRIRSSRGTAAALMPAPWSDK